MLEEQILDRLLQLILKEKTIISVFFIVNALLLSISLAHYSNTDVTTAFIWVRLILFVIVCFILILAFIGVRIALKTTSALLIIYGIWFLILGVFGLSLSQLLLKISIVIIGLYFLFSGKTIYGGRIATSKTDNSV